ASAQLGENYVFDSYDLEYTGVKADFENQLLTLTISFTAQLEKPIDSEATEERIRGKKEAELTSIINAIDGVKKAEISLWPFWVKTVPQSPEKVKVVVD
ncbi:MAG: hypothetical protein Q8P45_01555, partial [Candidatus Harrisonbacteria bacterium]|nr:hypothetical protein [Candidatus Harrisonbacteria bacterium]